MSRRCARCGWHQLLEAAVTELADVYPIDMGRRVADGPLWRRELRGAESVCEVGAGDGRVLRLVCDHPEYDGSVRQWAGIDLSPAMLARFAMQSTAIPRCPLLPWVCGDAAEPQTWETLCRRDQLQAGLFDVVFAAYSTLWLLPHDRQEQLLRLAATYLRPGGRALFEVFRPRWTSSERYYESTGVVTPVDRPASERGLWGRSSTFDVDAAERTTRVRRTYGPVGGDAVHVLHETIYWREPAGLLSFAEDAGFADASVLPATDGTLLLSCRS